MLEKKSQSSPVVWLCRGQGARLEWGLHEGIGENEEVCTRLGLGQGAAKLITTAHRTLAEVEREVDGSATPRASGEKKGKCCVSGQ